MGIMGTFILLATEATAEAAEHGGFGLNLNLLETNLFNLAIIGGLLFVFGRKFLGNILSERRARIEAAIQEAETKRKQAEANLKEAQTKLAQAQAEAAKIRSDAQTSAESAKEAILAKAAQDVERLKQTAAQDLNAEQEKAIAQLRAIVSAQALERVENYLRTQLDDSAQQQVVDRSIATITGGR